MVVDAIQAVGMITVSHQDGNASSLAWSHRKCGQTLQMLNAALRDPVAMRQDQTLLTILLLSVFESQCLVGDVPAKPWKTHMRGASKLLKLRGFAACLSPIGATLFFELRTQALIACVWQRIPIPSFYIEWPKRLGRLLDAIPDMALGEEGFQVIADFCQLRADITSFGSDPHTLYRRAVEVELAAVGYAEKVTERANWRYEIVTDPQAEKDGLFWQGKAHKYATVHGLRSWSSYRFLRTMLSGLQLALLRIISSSTPRTSPGESLDETVKFLMDTQREFVNEICASIPATFGYFELQGDATNSMLRSHPVLWSLFVAGRAIISAKLEIQWRDPDLETTESQMEFAHYEKQLGWIIGQLKFIWKDIGVVWVAGLVGALQGNPDTHPDYLDLLDDMTHALRHVSVEPME